jgi:hypothetical protein
LTAVLRSLLFCSGGLTRGNVTDVQRERVTLGDRAMQRGAAIGLRELASPRSSSITNQHSRPASSAGPTREHRVRVPKTNEMVLRLLEDCADHARK